MDLRMRRVGFHVREQRLGECVALDALGRRVDEAHRGRSLYELPLPVLGSSTFIKLFLTSGNTIPEKHQKKHCSPASLQ